MVCFEMSGAKLIIRGTAEELLAEGVTAQLGLGEIRRPRLLCFV